MGPFLCAQNAKINKLICCNILPALISALLGAFKNHGVYPGLST